MSVGVDEEPLFSVAHRGRRAVLTCHQGRLTEGDPPNALSSIAACVEAGAQRVELDVTFTADDVPVLSHDEIFQVRGRKVPARTVASEEVPHLPRLAEVVPLFAGWGCLLQVDLKRRGPMTPGEVRALAEVLRPLGPNVIVGSQAHWNLRMLATEGLTVAFDPWLHLRYVPSSAPRWWTAGAPRRTGTWGFRDDAAYAGDRGWSFERYLAARLDDLLALVPGCVELMVDIGTILRIGELGLPLGRELAQRGVALAAWTVRSFRGQETIDLVCRLLELGATTVITDVPLEIWMAMRGSEAVADHAGATPSPPAVPVAPAPECRM
ncbi:hypothetical protein HRbin29_00829 [bacterium HR29]|jgi:glycerophosphoryl diester phosphodiesterase|nr:hypothetical protein HRbin29_00829 [bacterium HR29]